MCIELLMLLSIGKLTALTKLHKTQRCDTFSGISLFQPPEKRKFVLIACILTVTELYPQKEPSKQDSLICPKVSQIERFHCMEYLSLYKCMLYFFLFHLIISEFVANALTYVGNHTGPCLIQLNGQAIVIVLTNGEEINQWPYNCIRQFRAEDESGKFSFVSGRRGPYGVAEYNFSMPNNSLINLQGALTEFTGAQFSAIAPGSGTDQQPLQMPQPLPPYPSMLPYQSNTQSFTLPHRMTTGRKDSVLSDVSTDSAFSSPIHSSQLPKLPPRDYIQAVPIKDDERLISRSRTSSSLSSSQSMDIGTRPSLPPPRRDAKELSPETLVAKSTTYEETHVISQQQNQVAEKGKPSIVPSKKKSLLSRIRRSDKSNVER